MAAHPEALLFGRTSGGVNVPLRVDALGRLVTTGGSPSNPFDQDLNTTDNVTFNTVTATGLHFITREIPTGAIDGANATYTLAHTPIAGSESIFLDGLLQEVGALKDYTISGVTITFNTAPLITTTSLLVTYRY